MADSVIEQTDDAEARQRATAFLQLTEPRDWTYRTKTGDRSHKDTYHSQSTRNGELWVKFQSKYVVPLNLLSKADQTAVRELGRLQSQIVQDFKAAERSNAAKLHAEEAEREQRDAEAEAARLRIAELEAQRRLREAENAPPDSSLLPDAGSEGFAFTANKPPIGNGTQPITLGIAYNELPTGDRIQLIVTGVQQGGLAEQLGIRAQERIVGIDGQPIPSIDDLKTRLNAGPPMTLLVRDINGQVRPVQIAAPNAGGQPGFAGNMPGGIDVTRQYRLHNATFGENRSLNCNNNGQLLMAANAFSPEQNWRIVPTPDGNGQYRITNGLLGADWSLTAKPGRPPATEKTDASSVHQLWSIRPLAGNDYQITRSLNGVNWGLGVGSSNDPRLVLVEQAEAPNQQWTFVSLNVVPNAAMIGRWAEYSLPANAPSGALVTIGPDQSLVRTENGQSKKLGTIEVSPNQFMLVYNNGQRETFGYSTEGNSIRFFQANGAPANFYWRLIANEIGGPPDVQPKLISSETVPNPPLPPANVQFANTYKEELWIFLRDKKDDSGTQYLKIPAGRSQTVQLERDAGGKIVETWSVPLPTGEVREETRERQLQVPVRYRLSVYEKFLQSVGYDARKGQRKRVTDVNYTPKSVGMFELPPGGELQDGRIDAYRSAVRQNNSGAVEQVDPKAWTSNGGDSDNNPLKKLLKSNQ